MPHSSNSDGTLVLLTLAGDPAAYDELFLRHEKRVLAAAYSVIRNAHIAEDAAQDAFLAAWLKLDRLREPEKFGIWVCRIAKNCARNMALRFRNYLCLDDVEGIEYMRADGGDPELMLMTEEEAELMRRGLRRLPERARQVVYLHYYEDMSAEDIAKLMGISVGTVKSQLHDGRKKMRKELCAMDEKLNDTLLLKIRKKIDEVKSWQYKNSKEGFDKVYRDVLKDIDTMPECREKYHALADVLMRGYWWLPGEKNDCLLGRIREAAKLGKNNEVMSYVLVREAAKYWGDEKREYIKNVQIPSLDPVDFRLTLADRWCAVGDLTKPENLKDGTDAFDSALALLTPADVLYHHALEMKKAFLESAEEKFISDIKNRKNVCVTYEFVMSDGLKIARDEYYSFGGLYALNYMCTQLFENLFRCDGEMTADIAPGESVTASDGSTLTFESGDETVTVPAGTFSGCEVWVSRLKAGTVRSWLKRGVGLVRQEMICEGVSDIKSLKAYSVSGDEGLLPLSAGNVWEYEMDCDPASFSAPTRIRVAWSDGERAIVTENTRVVRSRYDENSWLDMILKTRDDYCTRNPERIADVRPYARRAVELAKTPFEKAHAEAAYSVVKRIIETDEEFDPECEAVGLWNFFSRNTVEHADGKLCLIRTGRRFDFEWKNTDDTSLCNRLLSNHIYSILHDVTGCLFDERWQPGYSSEESRDYGSNSIIRTRISCADAGTVTVCAGSFDNCLSVDTYCGGFDSGHSYRGGRRTYYFAPGVGLVKVEIYTGAGSVSAYELTSYEGTGEGYMPAKDGMRRRYEGLGLTDGYEGAAEYTYALDCEGKLVIFSDLTGIRHKPKKITRYNSTVGELEEACLANTENYDGANLESGYNAILLLLHQTSKRDCHYSDPLTRARRFTYYLRLLEAAGDGSVPPAFLAKASRICLLASLAFFGGGEHENGYKYLELALDYAERWHAIPDGEALSFGDEAAFDNIRYIKGQSIIELPDGTKREIDADGTIDGWLSDSGMIYRAMTSTQRSWGWFDPAREDERYKKLTERAKKLTE